VPARGGGEPAGTTRWEREDEDVHLMLRFKSGQREAFEELVRRNTGRVHALIYRFLGEPGLVDDLTQEVFLRVLRTAPRYEPRAKFSTWLYRIVANLSFNVLRNRHKGRELQVDLGGSDDPDAMYRNLPDRAGAVPPDRLAEEELQAKVAEAVNGLLENQKIAIILNKYEGKDYRQIAAVLGCSTMAVKSLLSRARSNLREALGKYLRDGKG
jgi:RNA polymerase sigma-70 factor (ECF subfamily)